MLPLVSVTADQSVAQLLWGRWKDVRLETEAVGSLQPLHMSKSV